MTQPEQRSDGANVKRRSAARGRWSLRTLGGALALTSLCGLAGSPVEGAPAATAAGAATVKKDAAKGAAPRLALLVGVGRYPVAAGKTPWRTLHTHDEIEALRKVLIERHGFAPGDVLVLEDEKASGAAIREAFARHLIGRARRGSVVFFHFSGHGQPLRDKNGDENDGLDESIVPGDAQDQSAQAGERTNIVDDELAGWLRTLGDKLRGVGGKVDGSIVLSFDSCYSGTMSRGAFVERGRGWDPELDGPRPQGKAVDGASRSAEAKLDATLDLDPRDYVLLTAARSDQTAKEDGGMGIYSRALVAALTRLPRDVSYRTLLHEVAMDMRQTLSNQNPELEGDADRRLFGAEPGKKAPLFLTVSQVQGERIEIPVGSLHLATEGSVYALHRRGAEPPSATTLLAEAEVVEVRPTTSWLKLRKHGKAWSAADLGAARVVEKEHAFAGQPLRVLCREASGGPCTSPTLRAALKGLEQAGLVLPLGAQTSAAPAAGEDRYDVMIVPKPTQIELYRPESGKPIVELPARLQGEALAQALTERLRAEWRWRRLFALHGQSDFVKLAVRLMPVRASRSAAGLVMETPVPLSPQGSGSLRLPEGQTYQLEVTNSSPGPVYVTVLELGPNGSIDVLFPRADRPGDARIAADARPRVLSLPYVFETEAPLGGWTIKAIATIEPTDFSSLVQEASTLRTTEVASRGDALRQRAGQHPLGDLLLEALSGDLLRSRRLPVALGTWATDTALLDVVEVKTVGAAKAGPAR